MEQYYSVKQVSSNFSLPCGADKQTEDKMTDRQTEKYENNKTNLKINNENKHSL